MPGPPVGIVLSPGCQRPRSRWGQCSTEPLSPRPRSRRWVTDPLLCALVTATHSLHPPQVTAAQESHWASSGSAAAGAPSRRWPPQVLVRRRRLIPELHHNAPVLLRPSTGEPLHRATATVESPLRWASPPRCTSIEFPTLPCCPSCHPWPTSPMADAKIRLATTALLLPPTAAHVLRGGLPTQEEGRRGRWPWAKPHVSGSRSV
jgi:hypothetical protein